MFLGQPVTSRKVLRPEDPPVDKDGRAFRCGEVRLAAKASAKMRSRSPTVIPVQNGNQYSSSGM
jgi:hypothetical protein